MTRGWPPAVKVCGLMRHGDAAAAAEAGAAYLGVILAPGFRRTVAPADAAAIFGGLAARRVGVFVDADADELLRAADAAGVQVLQLHGAEPPALADELGGRGYEVWKAVRVRGADDFSAAVARYAGSVGTLLLDGYHPAAAGGTGTAFPWHEVAARRGELPAGMRLVVAGGLTPANVARAAAALRPDVVDVSSGVESAVGVKDPAAMRGFVAAVRGMTTAGE